MTTLEIINAISGAIGSAGITAVAIIHALKSKNGNPTNGNTGGTA